MYNLLLKNCIRNTANVSCFPGREEAWTVQGGAGTVLSPVAKPTQIIPCPLPAHPASLHWANVFVTKKMLPKPAHKVPCREARGYATHQAVLLIAGNKHSKEHEESTANSFPWVFVLRACVWCFWKIILEAPCEFGSCSFRAQPQCPVTCKDCHSAETANNEK